MDSQPGETASEQPDEVVTAQEFSALVRELSNWSRWGPEDQRGALHFLTAERIAETTRLVRDGVTVSLSLPLNTVVTGQGAAVNSIEVLRDGLVGRGVLLDIPRVRGVPWLEPGEVL